MAQRFSATAIVIPFSACLRTISFEPLPAASTADRSATLSTPTVFFTNSDEEKSPCTFSRSVASYVIRGTFQYSARAFIPGSSAFMSIVAIAPTSAASTPFSARTRSANSLISSELLPFLQPMPTAYLPGHSLIVARFSAAGLSACAP